MDFPKIYLAIDNCFASKRWTAPEQWMGLCSEWGVQYIEASADTECDPLYTTPAYIEDWTGKILDYSKKSGVHISSMYSGHGTYATLGLAHDDARIRTHILRDWLRPMVDTAAGLNAGLGFFCHAFSAQMLKNASAYQDGLNSLYQEIEEITRYASEKNLKFICTEQMYSPHQFPWTIATAQTFLSTVFQRTGAPMYLTVDTGHASGQKTFQRPSRAALKAYLEHPQSGSTAASIWLGPEAVYGAVRRTAGNAEQAAGQLLQLMEQYPYMFAEERDGDPYAWLRTYGCYSPVIHLQQTDGTFSKHLPFTAQTNETGIIHGKRLLQAIYDSYLRSCAGMPPKCKEIYLTLEIFSGTAEYNADIKQKMQESAAYWRKFVPKDGMRLDELVAALS